MLLQGYINSGINIVCRDILIYIDSGIYIVCRDIFIDSGINIVCRDILIQGYILCAGIY